MSSPHPPHLPPRPVPNSSTSSSKLKKAEKGGHTPKGSIEGIEEGWSVTFPRDGRRGSLGTGNEGVGGSAEKIGVGKGKKTAEDIVSLVKSFSLTGIAPKWSLASDLKTNATPITSTSPRQSLDKANAKEINPIPAPTAPIFIPFRSAGFVKPATPAAKFEEEEERKEGPSASITAQIDQRWQWDQHHQYSTSNRSTTGTSFGLSSPIFPLSDDGKEVGPKCLKESDRIASLDLRKIWEDEGKSASSVSREYRSQPMPSRHAEYTTPSQPLHANQSEPARGLPNAISPSDTMTSPVPDFLSTPGFGGFYQFARSGQQSSSSTLQQTQEPEVETTPQSFILPQTSNWSQWETPRTAPHSSSRHSLNPAPRHSASEAQYISQLSPEWRPRYNDAVPPTPQTSAYTSGITSVERGLSPLYRFATPGVEVRSQSGRSEREMVPQRDVGREVQRGRDEMMRTPIRANTPRMSNYGGSGSTLDIYGAGSRTVENVYQDWAGMNRETLPTHGSRFETGTSMLGMGAGIYDQGPPSAVPFAPGDWICRQPYCDYHNFSRNVDCRACGAGKPWEGPPSEMPNSPPLGSVGDWRCECGFINWRRRSLCMQCYPEHRTNEPTPRRFGSGSRDRGLASPSTAGPLSPPPMSPSQLWMGHTHALGGRAGEEWHWDGGVEEGRRGLDDVFARAITPTRGNGEGGRKREDNVFGEGVWGEGRGGGSGNW